MNAVGPGTAPRGPEKVELEPQRALKGVNELPSQECRRAPEESSKDREGLRDIQGAQHTS